MIFFLLAGSLCLQGQPPYDVAVAQDETVKPADDTQAPCATFIDFKQECNDQGEVIVSFSIRNNTNVNVSNVWVYLDDLTFVASLGGILPPGGTSSTITYQVPAGETSVCFNVRLLNLKGQACCYTRRCFAIDECPCAEIGKIGINCIDGSTDTYEFCIGIINPAYATNTIDVVMLSSLFPDLCINGIPAPAPIVISPIAPGDSDVICVTLSGCTSPLLNAEDITITPHLLDSTDPSYCCDLDPITVTTPCCVTGTCAPFNLNLSGGNTPPVTIVSGVTATLNFTFNTQWVPDQLIVTVNGNQALNSGPWSSNGSNGCGGLPAGGAFTGQVNIVPCDIVTITVLGNVCNVGGTGWNLAVTCNGISPQISAQMLAQSAAIESGIVAHDDDKEKRMSQTSNNTLKIFPNPVRETLTIKNDNADVEFETINVLDASGKIIMTDNMSGNSEIRVNVSSLPRGIYFIDAMDSTGNKVTERFVKVN